MKNTTAAGGIISALFCFFNLLLMAGTAASIHDFEMLDIDGNIRWNFDKFLIDKNGTLINRFHPKIKPRDPKVIEAALSGK